MATPTAGDLEYRVRNWLSSYNKQKLESQDILDLMNEAASNLAQLFDFWFLYLWGGVTRDADNAVWETRAIPPPTREDGAALSAAAIAAGAVPVNVAYLRALPYPDGLLRPKRAYYGQISKNTKLEFYQEEEYEGTYDFETKDQTPTSYALAGNSVLLGPCPSFEASIWVQGYYLPTFLEEEADENEFTRHAHQLLVYSTQNLIIKYNYEEEVRAGLFKEEYAQALRAALAQTGRTQDVARQSRMRRKG
jgi:hypothetical protein